MDQNPSQTPNIPQNTGIRISLRNNEEEKTPQPPPQASNKITISIGGGPIQVNNQDNQEEEYEYDDEDDYYNDYSNSVDQVQQENNVNQQFTGQYQGMERENYSYPVEYQHQVRVSNEPSQQDSSFFLAKPNYQEQENSEQQDEHSSFISPIKIGLGPPEKKSEPPKIEIEEQLPPKTEEHQLPDLPQQQQPVQQSQNQTKIQINFNITNLQDSYSRSQSYQLNDDYDDEEMDYEDSVSRPQDDSQPMVIDQTQNQPPPSTPFQEPNIPQPQINQPSQIQINYTPQVQTSQPPSTSITIPQQPPEEQKPAQQSFKISFSQVEPTPPPAQEQPIRLMTSSQPSEPPIPLSQPINTSKPDKKEKKKKKRKKFKQDLLHLYNLDKTKMNMELDPQMNGARFLVTYTLKLKEEEVVKSFIDNLNPEVYKRCILEAAFQAKFCQITQVCLILGKDEKIEKSFNYPDAQTQTQFQKANYDTTSKDLHSYETNQNDYVNNKNYPLLTIPKVLDYKLKAEEPPQFKEKIKISISYHIPNILNFGIKKVPYKTPNQVQTKSQEQQISYYYYTSDNFEQSILWLPVLNGTQKLPVRWTLNFVVPEGYSVIASGALIQRQQEAEGMKRMLFNYKLFDRDISIPEKIGFIIGQIPYLHKLNDLSAHACPKGFYTFFLNEKKRDTFKWNNFYERIIEQVTNYFQKLIQDVYPCNSNKLVFVPNLFPCKSRKQSIDFSGGLHILDEELLFQRNVLENRHKTYKYLTSSLAYDYFGGKKIEENPIDFWLLLGIRESLGNHIKIQKCGSLLYRYHIMKTIESLQKKMKKGIERYPIISSQNQIPHPAEQLFNEMIYQKCELIMHMIESMIDKANYDAILRELYYSQSPCVSTGLFLRIFKEVCGFKLRQFYNNWISSTSCPKLTASYEYNKKNNSLDLKIHQSSSMKDFFQFRKYLDNNINRINELPINKKDIKKQIKYHEHMEQLFVETKRECMRWFAGDVNVMLYLTDGNEIHKQQQKMNLKWGKTTVTVNIPLEKKVRRTIQNKKKELENIANDMELDDEEDDHAQERHQRMIESSSWKFGMNQFELEDYPIGTKDMFDVKNLESPVLWIRVDPDMEYIRKVKVEQEKQNWLFQLLQEKDIIGQIEAIRVLKKYQNELVYEILKNIATNENFFFKVRKEALDTLQKMDTAKFNQYLSHEKYLIKIFNQRNFDQKIGFYKSNDFTKILEYFFDKYILKTLAKCKESQLVLKEDVKQQIEQAKMLISTDTEIIQDTLVQPNQPDSKYINVTSENISALLLKLLQENDNSENPIDDCFFIKQILSSLGNLDNFKSMPNIASEIYRQFKLDQIGKFSPQYAIARGSIKGYYNILKQIYVFNHHKKHFMDFSQEDLLWYDGQITATMQNLERMGKDIELILKGAEWPYWIREFVIQQEIKHTFKYRSNSFLKALYLILKQVDEFQRNQDYVIANEWLKKLAYFLEQNWDKLDYREAYAKGERPEAIVKILWSFLVLPFTFIDQEFTYWVKRIYHQLYHIRIPYCIQEEQQNLQRQRKVVIAPCDFDQEWDKGEESQSQNQQDQRDKQLNRLLQTSTAQSDLRLTRQNLSQLPKTSFNPNDSVIRIFGDNQQQNQGSRKIRIDFGGGSQFRQDPQPLPVQPAKRELILPDYDENEESVYDEFAETKFEVDWMQKCWEILGTLWYHEESLAFLEPVTEDVLGEWFEDYLQSIQEPMDFSTIKQKMIERKYEGPAQFKYDVFLTFRNCKQFNHESSEIHQSAVKLEKFFLNKLQEYGMLSGEGIVLRIR